MSWFLQLQQASFRGIPFGVLSADGHFGRRQAVHEYPFRDKPFIEDLGRSTRRISLRGFLVTDSQIYGGGDVIAQREQMIGAAEAFGPGTLVHPTLGQLNVSLLDLVVSEKWDEGQYFELAFSFFEAGERLFPSQAGGTAAATLDGAGGLDLAGAGDFLARATADLKYGAQVINQVVSTAAKWTAPALQLVRDATNLSHLASILPGTFGRYFGGANVGGLGLLGETGNLIFGAATSVSSLIIAGTVARALVGNAVTTLTGLAAQNSPTAFATSAQAVADAVRLACINPADSIRLLSALAKQQLTDPILGSPVGAAMADIQTASNDLFRRAAVAALARASSTYQPSSYDDAVNVRNTVTAALDTELQIAGDQGEDASYQALRTLRLAVVSDLTTRGANLATITTYTEPSPLPALYLANRIYRDASRADQLVQQINPRHPLFCPVSFRALSA